MLNGNYKYRTIYKKQLGIALFGILLWFTNSQKKPEIIKEPWIEKPIPEWPNFVLTNTVQFTDTTYTGIANSFVVATDSNTLAVSCKHIFLVFKNNGVNTIELGKDFLKWTMHPKTQNDKNVIIKNLINQNNKERIGAFNKLKDRDWIIFNIENKDNQIYPLKIRKAPLKKGEIIYAVGWAYRQTTTEPTIVKMQMFENLGNYYYVRTLSQNIDPTGRSGSPVIDENGYLVGLVSGAEGNLGVIGSVAYLFKLFDQYGIKYKTTAP